MTYKRHGTLYIFFRFLLALGMNFQLLVVICLKSI